MTERLRQMMDDEEFTSLVDSVRKDLVGTVMDCSTTDEDRAGALAEHHALERVMKKLKSKINKAKKRDES